MFLCCRSHDIMEKGVGVYCKLVVGVELTRGGYVIVLTDSLNESGIT